VICVIVFVCSRPRLCDSVIKARTHNLYRVRERAKVSVRLCERMRCCQAFVDAKSFIANG
jgi:hypothetical protein